MGAPLGNKNGQIKGQWAGALRRALKTYEDKGKTNAEGKETRKRVNRGEALQRVAYKVIDLALDGRQDAVKELGERLDGKATIAIDVTEDVQITSIERRVIVIEQADAKIINSAIDEETKLIESD